MPGRRLTVSTRALTVRVARLAAARQPDSGFDAEPANTIINDQPASSILNLTCPQVRIHLPTDFVSLAAADPALAVAWRLHTRSSCHLSGLCDYWSIRVRLYL